MPDVSTKIYSIGELREIVLPLLERRGMRSASVFGSYARGEADASSDIDLLVDRGGGRVTRIAGLCSDVMAATGKDVDVYDVSELLPGPFRDEVLREAVAL